MNKLLVTAAVIFGFSGVAQSEPPKELEKTEKVATKSNRQEKKAAKKSERAHKILEACEAAFSELEEKGKSLTGAEKKIFELFVAHAKLERDAAKDPEMADHMMKHARHCKRYMGNADKYVKQAEKQIETAEPKPKKE